MDPWQWLSEGAAGKDDPASAEGMGEEALLRLLHDHVQKGYDHELDDNESVWRTLPLFAVLFGFAGALLNFIASKAPPLEHGWTAYLALVLLLANAGICGWAIRFGWTIIRPRLYRRIPRDSEVLNFARATRQYYLDSGRNEIQADRMATRELRAFLVDQLASASTQIQELNKTKAQARADMLFYLFIGFLFSFLLCGPMIMGDHFLPTTGQGAAGHAATAIPAEGGSEAAQVSAATPHASAPAIYRGGRQSSLPEEKGGLTPVLKAESTGKAKDQDDAGGIRNVER